MTTIKCGWCGKEFPANAQGCECKWRAQSFERLCVRCKKPMPLKANKCPECNQLQFSKTEFLHVRCGNCKGKDSVLWEIDDLFVALNCPLIFQTKKFVKIRWFKRRALGAAQTYVRYFQPLQRGTSVRTIQLGLLIDDEEPWGFPTTERAIAFLNHFPCTKCGKKNWQHYVIDDIKEGGKKAAAVATPYAMPAAVWLWGAIVGIVAALSKFTEGVWKFFATSPKQKRQEDGDEEGGGRQNNQRRNGNRRRKGGKI